MVWWLPSPNHEKGLGLEQQGMGLEIGVSKENITPMDSILEVGEADGNQVPK